jgi:hypothetical protein
MTRPTNAQRQYVHTAAADEEPTESSPTAPGMANGEASMRKTGEKKAVCYRCQQGITRGHATYAVTVWAASNRPQTVTVCGVCRLR